MQIKNKYNWLKHLDFMIADLLSLILAFLIAYRLNFGGLGFYRSLSWKRYALIFSLVNILLAFATNPYSGIFRRKYYQGVVQSVKTTFYNLLLMSIIIYFMGYTYSKWLMLEMYALFFLLSTIFRYVWKRLLLSGKIIIFTTKKIPLFIIGRRGNIKRVIRNVTAGEMQLYDIRGVYLVDNNNNNKTVNVKIDGDMNFIPVIGQDYLEYILNENIEEVLIATSLELIDQSIYKKLSDNGIGLNIVIEKVTGFQPEEQYVQNFGVYKALSIGIFSFTPEQLLYLKIKRLIDILGGAIGVFSLLFIAAGVKIAYLLNSDSAPILYRQDRVGQNGKKIRIWKFRSMVPNAEEVLEKLLKEEKWRLQWKAQQKLDNDPRITKVGRFIRKTSIDELPQLINVFMGDMSLIGPRPLVAGELEAHNGLKLYQKVKPGITGWWGCNGRSNINYRERLELEYYYVKNCSLSLDIICFFRTVMAVIKKDGAR
ncbi:MAG: exopolysaccharide biosynthesis polyprenyl glycosylphosphotransferase [Synergistaceae bacterium]|nr:exopolysaccharide biosynthesis polyprenyl glycosylphosphotransferase [Synergistaceae bacterium]